ncbi:MAG: hypothetical protein M0Z49_00795 [Chloroflexi bacterium]|nr:hypothetical protein [Chloroflexota bacterium]
MARSEAVDRIDALAGVGRQVSGARMAQGRYSDDFYASYTGWRAQATACIRDVAGQESPYYSQFIKTTEQPMAVAAAEGTAILEALSADVSAGYLRRQAELIAAEVFGDFLDMAQHLLDAGYHIPAASLIGAVLEDGLRRLARRHDLKVGPSDDIVVLNNRLASKGIYSNLARKQVDLWSATRNASDHGVFGEVKAENVTEMQAGVVRFLAEYLG